MNQRVDDPIAHEPDWQEVVDDLHCWQCDGQMLFASYDWLIKALEIKCAKCGEIDYHSTDELLRRAKEAGE